MKLLPIILFFLVINLHAQEERPFTVFTGGGCFLGLLDANKKEVLKAEYSSIESVSIGDDWLITTRRLNHFSYFLHKGNKLTPLKYPRVSKINSRLLKVGHPGEWGIIDTEGKGILLMNYDNIYAAGSSAAITVYKKAYGAIGVDGKTIINNKYSQLQHWEMGGFWALESDQFQLINSSGEVVAGPKYDFIGPLSPELPICAVSKGDKWGVIDAQNEWVVEMNYEEIKLLDIGLVAVLDNKEWQLMDIKGQQITDEKYDAVEELGGEVVLVTQGSQYGLLSKDGKILLPLEYTSIRYVGNAWLATSKEDGVVQIFSIDENKFLEPTFEAVKKANDLETSQGILIQKDKSWAWFNYTSQTIQSIYTKAYFYPKTNLIIVEDKNRRIGCLGSNGEVILPIEYVDIIPKGAYFKVKREAGNWLYVNKKNELINCQLY
jgi:hypothetical protein